VVRPESRPVTKADYARRAAFGIQLPEAPADGPGPLLGEPPRAAEEIPADPPPTPPREPQTAEEGGPDGGADPADLDDPWGPDDRVGLGPEPLLPRSALADWIEAQAAEYRKRGGTASQWLGRQLEQMASTARVLGAANGEQYDDRLDAMEDARDRRLAEEAVDRYCASLSAATA
jgi:hypothetical protein